jgi:hypothetical protein
VGALKPSEVTPLSAVQFVRGWAEVGAPPVLALATGYGDTGAAGIGNVDFVQFTGSAATGRKVAVARGERLLPYSRELGGKDPALVLADADLDRAANGIAWGGMPNSGQVCVSMQRVYVEAPVYDEFVAKLTENVRLLPQGQDDRKFAFDVGPLATSAQRDKVQRHVDEAIAAGARALTGGKPTGTGTFFEPTVLVDVDQSMSCMTEETFGPTLPVVKVADEAERIRLANDSVYGLSATVWTGDKECGERVARQLDVGAVNINDVDVECVRLPHPDGWLEAFGCRHPLGRCHRPSQILSATSDHVAAHTDISQGAALVSGLATAGQIRAGLIARVRGARCTPVWYQATGRVALATRSYPVRHRSPEFLQRDFGGVEVARAMSAAPRRCGRGADVHTRQPNAARRHLIRGPNLNNGPELLQPVEPRPERARLL